MMILKKADAQIIYENVIKFPRFSYEDNIGIIPAGMQFKKKKKSKFVSDFLSRTFNLRYRPSHTPVFTKCLQFNLKFPLQN